MMTLYDALKTKVREAATVLDLPLGFEGDVFTPPHGPHLRAQIVFTESATATLGVNGLVRTNGRIEIKVVTAAGEESQAAELTGSLVRLFPRGEEISFDDGLATLTTPQKGAPTGDGKRSEAVINVNFYAFQE